MVNGEFYFTSLLLGFLHRQLVKLLKMHFLAATKELIYTHCMCATVILSGQSSMLFLACPVQVNNWPECSAVKFTASLFSEHRRMTSTVIMILVMARGYSL